MRKLLMAAATGGLIAFGATAALADGMPRSTKDVPSYSPPPSWTGLYVAGGFGYGMWTAETTTTSPTTGLCVLCVAQEQGGKGALGVLGIGYDLQLHKSFVAGVFVDSSFSRIKGTIQDQGPFFAGSIEEDRAYSVGGRFGLLVHPSVLTYGTAGYSRAHFTGATMVTTFAGTPSGFSTPAFWRDGWFIGGGTEVALRSGFLWRTEYRYADYGTAVLTDTNAAGAAANNIVFPPIEQTVRTELVYKFNWFGR
jgi:outer membrane immunogenic protein